MSWEPRTSFRDGLHRTIDWYFTHKDRDQVRATLNDMLTERRAPDTSRHAVQPPKPDGVKPGGGQRA
jgi:hypothetical protein